VLLWRREAGPQGHGLEDARKGGQGAQHSVLAQ
jgi:hypothetical protein